MKKTATVIKTTVTTAGQAVIAAAAAQTNKAEEWTKNLRATIANRGGLGSGRGPTAVRMALENSVKKTLKSPPSAIPPKWTKSTTEENEKKKRWAKFAGFMSKPVNYSGAYSKDLQALDAKGCINLKRITRLQWPLSIDTNHVALIFFCSYEGLEGELSLSQNGINIVDDAALVAQTYLNRGFRVVYIHDPTVSEFTTWFDFFLEDAHQDIVVYFIGYGKTVLDENGEGGTCLLLYNQSRKKGSKNPPPAVTGATDHTVSEDYLYNNIAGVDYPEKRITFYLDLYKSASVFQVEPPEEAAAIKKLKSTHSTPPRNSQTVLIESIVDVDAIVKANAGKKPAAGDWSSKLAQKLANQVIEKGFFSSIVSFVSDLITSFVNPDSSPSSSPSTPPSSTHTTTPPSSTHTTTPPSSTHTTTPPSSTHTTTPPSSTHTTTPPSSTHTTTPTTNTTTTTTTVTTSVSPTVNPSKPNTQPIPPNNYETNITQVHDTNNHNGTPTNTITSLPPPDVSAAEKAGAEARWKQFLAEMTKPASYTSKYRAELQQLDAMGAVNLDRVTRAQIPDITIDNVIALFFNPYEGLPHTLDLGPINDGITMATLLTSRGYKVVYLCDGTPKEYYIWMDWLLDNVNHEIIAYFSGHGTQTRDYTGKETDGLSELLVFYDESKKSTSQAKKIKAVTGMTENTISDDLMHDLIISKQYPETRIILISDCCHSGTMFDFDAPIPANLEKNKPPLNVIAIGAAKDEQTAKQTVLAGKESGVFTHYFSELLKTKKQTTFNELQTYLTSKIAKYQDIQITTTHTTLLSKPIIVDPPK